MCYLEEFSQHRPRGFQFLVVLYYNVPANGIINYSLKANVLLFVLTGLLAGANASGKLVRRFAWKYMDYAFTPEERMKAILSGRYIPENNLPVGIEVVGDRMFISVPRWDKGVPSTLNWLSLGPESAESPLLQPYPDFETNEEGNCNGLTTVYRMRADECGRLWVLDSGTLGIGNTTEQLCPYALHAFDLKTNRQILRYQYKDTDINKDTFIANIAVDIGKDCSETWVYASDELGYGLLVYSLKDHDSWRFQHGFFRPDPLKGDFNIAGLNFQWDAEGIFGMALQPGHSPDRLLLFHPLASHTEFAVPVSVLRNKAKVDDSYHDFIVVGDRGDLAHSTSELMTDEGLMVHNLIDQNAIGCWDSRKPYNKENQAVIAKDDVELVFPSDVRVKDGVLWAISDRMPVHLEASLDFNDVNFRVFFASLRELVQGTVCDIYYPTNNFYGLKGYSAQNLPPRRLPNIAPPKVYENEPLFHRLPQASRNPSYHNFLYA